MAVEDSGTSFSSSYNCPPSSRSCAKVVNQVASAHPSKEYKSDCSFMDSGSYCQVSHGNNHKTSTCRHFKEDSQFVRAKNQNCESRFKTEGDHHRQTLYPAGYYSEPPPNRSSPSRTFKKTDSLVKGAIRDMRQPGPRIKPYLFERLNQPFDQHRTALRGYTHQDPLLSENVNTESAQVAAFGCHNYSNKADTVREEAEKRKSSKLAYKREVTTVHCQY